MNNVQATATNIDQWMEATVIVVLQKLLKKLHVNMKTIHWYLIKMSRVGIFSLSIKMMQKILMGCISQKFWAIIENIYSIAIAIPISYVHIHLAGLCNVV